MGAAGRSEPFPWDLEVRVRFAGSTGPDSLRADLERALVGDLERQGCFRSVAHAGGEGRPADLSLSVVLEEFEDEQVHDTTIAARHVAGAVPEVARSYVARIGARVHLQLDTVPGGGAVRRKTFVQRSAHRPVLNEDARLEAAREFTGGIVRVARGLVCRGSAKKLRRDVADALERLEQPR